jgi:HD-GYP domain-containing protein (c-di-GMP phosphodiesterase class II)
MGYSYEELAHVRRGALLHDIGKMAIPDHILFKPGELSPEEWDIIKQHPVWARDMLAGIPFLQPALSIPYCHHERWDGQGYPQGLKGEEIPLPARMFTVIDKFDALNSDRPYRAAWPREKSIAYLEENAGVIFDPEIVPVFLRLLKEDAFEI